VAYPLQIIHLQTFGHWADSVIFEVLLVHLHLLLNTRVTFPSDRFNNPSGQRSSKAVHFHYSGTRNPKTKAGLVGFQCYPFFQKLTFTSFSKQAMPPGCKIVARSGTAKPPETSSTSPQALDAESSTFISLDSPAEATTMSKEQPVILTAKDKRSVESNMRKFLRKVQSSRDRDNTKFFRVRGKPSSIQWHRKFAISECQPLQVSTNMNDDLKSQSSPQKAHDAEPKSSNLPLTNDGSDTIKLLNTPLLHVGAGSDLRERRKPLPDQRKEYLTSAATERTSASHVETSKVAQRCMNWSKRSSKKKRDLQGAKVRRHAEYRKKLGLSTSGRRVKQAGQESNQG
jgi:hypothetical protein